MGVERVEQKIHAPPGSTSSSSSSSSLLLSVKVPPRLSLDAKPAAKEAEQPLAAKVAYLMEKREEFLIPGSKVLGTETGHISEQYVLGKELGRGHFGVVRMCEEMGTRRQLACKSMDKVNLKKREDFKELQAEICVMHHLAGQPHIVQLVDIFEDDKAVHVIMELCEDGDLFDYIARKRRLPEAEAARIFRQVVLAVQACHKQGVIHRDLKPENILFSKMPGESSKDVSVKLADFGLAVQLKPGHLATGLAGSPFYMAPELVRRRKYSFEVDIWSLGVVLYTCISGFLPFWGKTHEQTFEAVCRGEPDLEKKPWQAVSPEAKSLVRKLLVLDPKKRATLEDVLNHPWILAYCPPKSSPQDRLKPLALHMQQCAVPASHQRETMPASWQPMQQALSAPKGRFSPPGTPSPRGEQKHFSSVSQFLPTPPSTPKGAGQASVSPFAAALGKPFKFVHYTGGTERDTKQPLSSVCPPSPPQASKQSSACLGKSELANSEEASDSDRTAKIGLQDSASSGGSSLDLTGGTSPRSPLDKASAGGLLQFSLKCQ